jgi:hypothetical protein
MAAAAASHAYNPAATAELIAAIPGEINRFVIKNTSNLFPGGANQTQYNFPYIQELLRRGADPNGLTDFMNSTIEKIINVIQGNSEKYQRAGLALFELLLQNGARPDHEYEYTSRFTRTKNTRIVWLQLFRHLTLMAVDPDASILKDWLQLLNKYGFNFSSPDFIEYVTEEMMLDCTETQRLKTAFTLFIKFGFPLKVAERLIEEYHCNADKNSLRNAIRKAVAMRIDFSAPAAGAGAGGAGGSKTIPPLPAHVKAKISSFIGGRSKSNRRRLRRKSRKHK